MILRIAIIAACAATFGLAQSNSAQAAYAGTTESKSAAAVGSEPAIRLAQSSVINTSHSNIRHPGETNNGGSNLPKASSNLPKAGSNLPKAGAKIKDNTSAMGSVSTTR